MPLSKISSRANPFDAFTNRGNRGSGCGRPGCGCLILIILLLLAAGYFFRGNLGINLPQINLPGGGTIFNQDQDEKENDNSTFDYNRDKDYGKKLKKLNDDDIDGI